MSASTSAANQIAGAIDSRIERRITVAALYTNFVLVDYPVKKMDRQKSMLLFAAQCLNNQETTYSRDAEEESQQKSPSKTPRHRFDAKRRFPATVTASNYFSSPLQLPLLASQVCLLGIVHSAHPGEPLLGAMITAVGALAAQRQADKSAGAEKLAPCDLTA